MVTSSRDKDKILLLLYVKQMKHKAVSPDVHIGDYDYNHTFKSDKKLYVMTKFIVQYQMDIQPNIFRYYTCKQPSSRVSLTLPLRPIPKIISKKIKNHLDMILVLIYLRGTHKDISDKAKDVTRTHWGETHNKL